MADYLVPQTLLTSLVALAKKAPVPYEQSEGVWVMLGRLQPHEPGVTRTATGPSDRLPESAKPKPEPAKKAKRAKPAPAKSDA